MNVEQAVARLNDFMGTRATTSRDVLDDHARSESYHASRSPGVVVFPESTEEVSRIVRLCHDFGLPVGAFGAGTSLEGNAASVSGGLCIDFARMHRVLAVRNKDLDVVVQPGITRKQLNAHLRETGLFLPIDPGAHASIGGMTSTRASKTMAVRYGTMKDNVLALGSCYPTGASSAPAIAHASPRRVTISRGCASAPKARSLLSPKSP